MESIAICIPVRYGSSRLPGKPLLKLGDKTIIELTIQRALLCPDIVPSQIFIFTDDQRIADVVKSKTSVNIIMTDSDCPNALYRLSKYIHLVPQKYTGFINLHGDEPFLDHRNLHHLIKEYLACKKTCILIKKSDNNMTHNSEVKAVTDTNMNMLYCSRSVIPYPAKNHQNHQYYGVIGLQAMDRDTLKKYDQCPTPPHGWLYQVEDIEELKILEIGQSIHCSLAPYPTTRSLNTLEDYQYFLKKNTVEKFTSRQDEVAFEKKV